ncbi:MAG: efflux RND transporter permease subunit [Steroidobacterales bacterium]
MARFFIDRPIFAWVIAIVIMLGGALAIYTLPIEQYPDIAPPSVSISASYPGASAQTVAESVTQVIEQQMTGLDHLLYMASNSSSQGQSNINLTFAAGTNPDIAQVQVQNKLQQAMRNLPQPVQNAGVNVNKSTTGFLMVVGFYSDDNSMSATDMGDYLATSLVDPISRVNGVGSVNIFGGQHAMRIWLDPGKLRRYSLIPGDVANAIKAQNTQVSAGQLGGLPAVAGQQLTATITALSKLQTPEQFRDIVLIANADGSAVHLGDVARVEIGSDNYEIAPRMNGREGAAIALSLTSGANAVTTADAVRQRLAELSKFFPQHLQMFYSFDTATFVKISINEVEKTLLEAIALVVVVMYLFMQSWRATLIPAIAVPVVLLGTFGVLALAGYSINTLTMFAMVLAIGLLVDDAIVVVENVERIMQEEGLAPREATRKSMEQITGALLGIALVLAAVFVPMAFIGGSTGVIYRQFSITIVSAMALSVLVALILTPALCATLLQPIHPAEYAARRGFFGWFNRTFYRNADRYRNVVGRITARLGRSFAVYALILALAALLYWRLPTSFLPEEDQGSLMVQVQLPPGATQQRTLATLDQIDRYLLGQADVVRAVQTVAGFSFGGNGQNNGLSFVRLRDWDERRGAGQSAAAFAQRANRTFSSLRDASVFAMIPALIRGLGISSGFDVQLQDNAGLGHAALLRARDQFIALAAQETALAQVRANGQPDETQYGIEIDERAAASLGLASADVNDTLSSALGGTYVNDFINKSRVKKVYMQGDAPYRMLPSDLQNWFVRNASGDMVPLSAFSTTKWNSGSPRLERYNGMSSVELIGEPSAGHSSGEAMNAVERIMKQLPNGIGYEWTGLSYQERIAGSQAPALYAISVLFVFLCLAALYESWSVPFSVMLAVPVGVVGALAAASLRGLNNDVYFQVGLLTTVGLAAKNAILIVEFAKELQEKEGLSLREATLRAVRIRLRPILMTSYAFMLGVLPLVLSSGAGAGGRVAIGTGVFGGMLTSTVLGVFFVPVFFIAIRRTFSRTTPEQTPAH